MNQKKRSNHKNKVIVENFSEELHFKNCLCCNQPTLRTQMHDICDNCGWQDDPASWKRDINDDNNANGISLRRARINYEKTGNCDGIEETLQRFFKATDLLKDGKTTTEITEITGFSEEIIQDIAKRIQKNRT